MIGSNVFNLAALRGFAAIIARRIALHRRVIVLEGVVALWIAAVCVAVVVGFLPPAVGLGLVLVVLGSYVIVLGVRRERLRRIGLPARWVGWLTIAIVEEEVELEVAIHPRRGADHPLTRAVAALQTVRRQSVVVAAILLGSLAADVLGASWAVGVGLSATIVLLTLAITAAVSLQRRRDSALELILQGRAGVPVAAVHRERQRLCSERTARHLARAFADMIDYALNPPRPCVRAARPLYSINVVAHAAEDLRHISRLLRAREASIQGVALAERLLTDGASPLYGDEASVLRERLQLIYRAMSD